MCELRLFRTTACVCALHLMTDCCLQASERRRSSQGCGFHDCVRKRCTHHHVVVDPRTKHVVNGGGVKLKRLQKQYAQPRNTCQCCMSSWARSSKKRHSCSCVLPPLIVHRPSTTISNALGLYLHQSQSLIGLNMLKYIRCVRKG